MTPAERLYMLEPYRMSQCRRHILEVAEETGFSVKDLIGPKRTRELVRARWVAMRLAHKDGIPKAQIGREFNRDHTSVIYALRQMEKELDA